MVGGWGGGKRTDWVPLSAPEGREGRCQRAGSALQNHEAGGCEVMFRGCHNGMGWVLQTDAMAMRQTEGGAAEGGPGQGSFLTPRHHWRGGGGGGAHPPPTRPALGHWAGLSSGPSANESFSLAPIRFDQKYSSEPVETQHRRGEGAGHSLGTPTVWFFLFVKERTRPRAGGCRPTAGSYWPTVVG